MVMVTGMTRDQPSCEDATRNRQPANVAATIDECVEVEGVLQESMLQQHHFSRYDQDYEIPYPPQNPESIPCSCSWALSNFATPVEASPHQETSFLALSNTPITANAHEQASFPLPPSDMQLQLATPSTDTNTSPTATTGDNRSQHQHVMMEEVEQRVCEEEAEEEEGEGERGRLQGKMDVRSTFMDTVKQFSCYSNDTFLHLNSDYNPTIFSLI